MKFILGMVMAFTVFLLTGPAAEANEITGMQMDVEINEDGSVSVTETREADMTEGTELYMVFNEEDMGEVQVTDFSVEGFTEEENWNMDADLEEKAGKYGVVETDDGTELVWGIGDYGEQSYVVNYTLENVVRNLEDGQSLYWNFDTFSELPTDNFRMNVTSDVPLDAEEIRFWGFGFEGDIVAVDEGVQWTAAETLSSGNDAVLLMHFPEGTFNTAVSDDGTLEEEAAAAMDGSIYDEGMGAGGIAAILGGIGAVVAAIFAFFMQYGSRQKKGGHIASARAVTKRNKGQESGVPPAVDDYAGISFVLMHLNMSYFEEIFQAYLMRWTDEGRITIEIDRQPNQKLSKGDPKIIIHDYQSLLSGYSYTFKEVSEQVDDEGLEGDYEPLLWRMLLDAADEAGVVDEKRLRKWSKKNAKAVGIIADELDAYSKDWLEANGYFEFKKDKVWGIPMQINAPTDEGEALLDQLAQYKNYLKTDYRRVYEDDDLYRKHLIWSVMTGEGDDVRKHLDKLTPDAGFDEIHTGMMYYYYGPHLASDSWSKGLGQGGFQSSNSSAAASGGGGTTGMGGGAGAGGGGGGGAR